MPSSIKPLIYLIDSDPMIYESLCFADSMADFEVIFFLSVSELLEALRQTAPSCLIVEVNLSTINGLELLQELQAEKIAPPTIFIATVGKVGEAVRAMRLGAVDYIEKPFIQNKLLSAILLTQK